jgi:hypothetical protein
MQPVPDDEFFAHRPDGPPSVVNRDRRLALAVVRALAGDARTRGEAVRVAAQNDVVLLNGTVGSRQSRTTAGELARRTPGAFDVCNALRIGPGAGEAEPDDEFADLVSAVREPWRPMASWRSGARGRLVLLLLVLMWILLPVGVIAGLPMVPLMIVGAVVTIVVEGIRFAHRRGSRL